MSFQTDTLNPFEIINGDISSPHDKNNNNNLSRLLTSYQNMEGSTTKSTSTSAVCGGPDDNSNEQESRNWPDNQQKIGDANNNVDSASELMDMRRQLDYLQVSVCE